MQLSTTFQTGRLTLHFSGELDHHAAKEAMQRIGRAIDLNLPRDCIMDFGALSFMDSSGIAVVLNTHKRMVEVGGRAHVVNVPRQPMKVLTASGIYRIVEIIEQEALA
ncbi:MAG: anti-sigma factor antagonist [Oscillospiraceae bacterium]|nr:anti-sigma factor antagonist [Oscillospiraceae bacterium]